MQDGLITLYLQHHNVAETMHEGQMQSLLRRKVTEKKLKYLKRAPGRSETILICVGCYLFLLSQSRWSNFLSYKHA